MDCSGCNRCTEINCSIDTKCQQLDRSLMDQYGAISFPIYQTATFAHPGLGESTGYDYSRVQNPTRKQLESIVGYLENGRDALAFSSGMAAIATLMELLKPGDHFIIDSDLYGGSVRLFNEISLKNGLTYTSANLSVSDIRPLIQENTKMVYLETPTNPMMNVTDIEELSKVTREKGILLVVDNTFLSPYFQNPLDLGADVVIHSGTKFLGGHHDTIGGFIVVKDEEIDERLRFIYKTTGAILSPFDSWLILRGIRTLAVRLERAQENALKLARFLKFNKHVTKVIYPGLEDHPGYEIMKKQARGFGAMLTFEVDSEEFAKSILRNVQLIYFAESLGGTETLITYPVTQTHADVPKEVLEKNGINERTLRLSVGIEGINDLLCEFGRVFAIAEKEVNG
ncbi:MULTISPECIES: trans-sulfuration enzyme family protein [unclassified Butyrivibrio]|uniref:trans-sulfuration enzyme family protein n=1 Tax=unclassified Butyrivibrio TaxID=2639466 RepID=UPI0003B4931F|nr:MULTISPECIES: PLP-dependent aspartate aminotransferase family protein [unclassified Butyrivibrio]MDC7295026.1 PLP-dependent aspartate aminotransferase family protein [Butyrivibrio sp. DSM 10294]